MRVRLYEMGGASLGMIFRIDNFPAALALDDAGNLLTRNEDRLPACHLEDHGGAIFVKVNDDNQQVGINGASIVSGPLKPGDQLRLGNRRYLVSYEQTNNEQQQGLKVRILN